MTSCSHTPVHGTCVLGELADNEGKDREPGRESEGRVEGLCVSIPILHESCARRIVPALCNVLPVVDAGCELARPGCPELEARDEVCRRPDSWMRWRQSSVACACAHLGIFWCDAATLKGGGDGMEIGVS